jgi:hypothetical protein
VGVVIAYRDKRVVGVFVRFSCAASQAMRHALDARGIVLVIVVGVDAGRQVVG